jgi:hypothetical protein
MTGLTGAPRSEQLEDRGNDLTVARAAGVL